MWSTASVLYGLATSSLLVSASPLARLTSRDVKDIEGWSYTGCFSEATGHRSLSSATIVHAAMTVQRCATFCGNAGYPVFGFEYGVECFCGPSLSLDTFPAPPGECNYPCPGKPSETCGAGNRLNVYNKQEDPLATTTSSTSSTTSSSIPLPTSHTFQGCYSEATEGRALTGKYVTSDALTVESCAASCAGYAYFGLEYYFECFCGNELQAGSIQVGGAECVYPCRGDASQTCGASYRLSMYSFGDSVPHPSLPTTTTTSAPAPTATALSGVIALGCYTDKTYSRALKGVTYFDDFMTLEKCFATCSEYEYFGVEYGGECYCGDELEGSEEVLIEQCNMPCKGNSAQTCGAGDRLNVYQYACVSSSSSTMMSSTLSSTSVLIESTTSYVPAATTISSSSSSTTSAPPVSTATQCAVKSTPPTDSVCGAHGMLNYLYDFNIIQTIVSPETETPEGCALACSEKAGCKSILHSVFVPNTGGTGFCKLIKETHPTSSFFSNANIPITGWNLDCFLCQVPPSVSTTTTTTESTTSSQTSELPSSTASELTTTTSAPASPTGPCIPKSSFPETSLCGVYGFVTETADSQYLDSLYDAASLTVQGCLQACSSRTNCASFRVNGQHCALFTVPLADVQFVASPTSDWFGADLNCYTCGAPSASTSFSSSSTTSEISSTTSAPPSPTGTCTAMTPLAETDSICGVDIVSLTVSSDNTLSVLSAPIYLTAPACALACREKTGCASFGVGQHCVLYTARLEALVFIPYQTGPASTWNLDCFVCDSTPESASTTSSSTTSEVSSSSTTTSEAVSTTSESLSSSSSSESTTTATTSETASTTSESSSSSSSSESTTTATTSETASTTSESSSSSSSSEPTTTTTSVEPTTSPTTSVFTTTSATPTPTPGPNLLQNPDFEGDTLIWQYTSLNLAVGEVSSVNVKTGAKAFRMYQESPVRDTRQLTLRQINFATPIGANYRVMIWANRISGNCALNINLQEQVMISRSGSAATGWVEMTGYVTATRETSSFSVRVTCSSIGPQEYFVDDVRFQRMI